MIEAYPSAEAAADVAAELIAGELRQGLDTHGRVGLVATGGRSPGPVFDRLSQAQLTWERVVVTLSDERCVAQDDPASNVGPVRARLLQGRAAKAHLLPLWPEPPEAALQALAPFAAVMLGMGEDGHIASLLPGDPGLAAAMAPDQLRMTAHVPAGLGKPPLARVSLTLSALLSTRAIFLLIAGEAKREVIARAEAGEDLPVRALIAQSRVPLKILWSPSHGG